MGWKHRAAVVATSVVVLAATASWLGRTSWGSHWSTPLPLVMLLAGVWLLFAAAIVVMRWRPTSRLWVLAIALTWAWAEFAVAVTLPLDEWLVPATLRPLLFWLVLAWPSGHLRRGDAVWLTIYSTAQLVLIWGMRQLLVPGAGRPLAIVDVPVVAEISAGFGLAVVIPVGAALLAVSVHRFANGVPAAGRRLLRPVVVAANVIVVSEVGVVVMVLTDDIGFDAEGNPASVVAGVQLAVNYLPYVVVPVLVLEAVRRARSAVASTSSIEVEEPTPVLRRMVGSVSADVATVCFAVPGGTWVDIEGRSVSPPAGQQLVIRRDDDVLAMVAAAPGVEVPQDRVERLVAAAGASVDFARLEATAKATRRDVVAARRAMEQARDTALDRMERDLHDGAQQRLVGLALQASLARRAGLDGDDTAAELLGGTRAAREEITDAARGLVPVMIEHRGLDAAIGSLATCAGLDVRVDVRLPRELPPDVAAAAWFVVAEAIANAAKHAGATGVVVAASVDDARNALVATVTDDGGGGADAAGSGLRGLRARVERVGGCLDVASSLGAGTTVRASFPIPVSSVAAS